MVSEFKDNFIYNYEKIQDEISAGGFTPKIYPVFLNAKKVNKKDFNNGSFVESEALKVADLVEEALNTNLDGSIIENIKDPVTATNYAVFRSNQIKSVFNKKDYTSQDNFYNQVINGKIIGQANIRAMSVLIDAVNQKDDTLPHEYAHHYIAWYRNTPIVQEAIKKWGSEEALVQSIGEQVVKQKGEAFDWWNKFTKWILDKFNNLSKLQKEELTQILTDAFLTRQNVNQSTEIKPKIDSSKKIENLKRGDIINFQQQEFLVERVKNEGIDVRDVNTGDVDFISTEDYINETQEQSIVEENVTNNQNTQEQGNEFTPEDLGLNTDSNQNDAVCK